MEKLRIGVVGLGGIATRMHIPALAAIPDVTVYAGAEINREQAERTQRRFGIPHVYSSYDEMYESAALDGIYVCLPNFLHVDAIQKALARNLHVFCEKPMGLSATEAAAVAQLAEERHRLLMPGYNMRYVPNYTRAKELIRGKRLGKILQIQATMAKPGPYTGWDPKSDWYYDRDNIGVLYDLGGHAVDLIRYVCDVEITEIQATATTTLPGLEVPDSIVTTFRTDSSAIGTINLSWGACANVDMLTVHGTAGSVITSWHYFEHLKPGSGGVDKMGVLLDNAAVIVRRVLRSIVRRGIATDPYLLISQDFARSISNGISPRITAMDGVRTLEVLNKVAHLLAVGEKEWMQL